MTQEFECKEPGCDGTVKYDRVVVKGLTEGELSKKNRDSTKTVYLTCDKDRDHWYDYEIEEQD